MTHQGPARGGPQQTLVEQGPRVLSSQPGEEEPAPGACKGKKSPGGVGWLPRTPLCTSRWATYRDRVVLGAEGGPGVEARLPGQRLLCPLISDSPESDGQPQPWGAGVIDASESVATSLAAPKRGFWGRKSCPRWSLHCLPAAQLSSEISPHWAERGLGAPAFPRNHVRVPRAEEGA